MTDPRQVARTGVVRAGFCRCTGLWPNWHRSVMTPAVKLCAGDLAHGVMEGQAGDLDMEVNGVAGEVPFRPAPVGVFDDEVGIGGQNIIVGLAGDELESAVLEQRHQRCQPGGADLFARPPDALTPRRGDICKFNCIYGPCQ